MEKKTKLFGQNYVPAYAEKYFDLPWYERDLMRCYSYLDYKDMSDDPDNYFQHKNVINFDLIHHECRGDPFLKSGKEYKTTSSDNFEKYPESEKNKTLSSVFRNKRDDLWVKHDLMIEPFKKYFIFL